jgi:arylsulfatase A-like enzyme
LKGVALPCRRGRWPPGTALRHPGHDTFGAMRRREFLSAACGTALARGAQSAADKPPNILFLMPDQWRGMDLGSMGNRQVRTPVLDQLAAEGVQFTGCVANTPVCTPARGMLLTGKYAHATRTAVNDVPLPVEEVTIAEILQRQGYYTGFIGKWHLEGGLRMPGFVAPGARRQGFEFWGANICSHDYFRQQFFRDTPEPVRMPGYETFTWTDLGVEFLEKARQRRQPFCLYVQYGPPHDPYIPPPGYGTMYDPAKIELRKNWREGAKRNGSAKDIAGYYAAIACLDAEIGRLLKKLDEAGERDNTIVLFSSDHGDMLGSHGTFLKRKPWEESVRVPGILRWPRRLKAGRRTDAPFSHVDVVPTLLGLAGVKTPVAMHGHDYSDYLRGETDKTPEHAHLAIYTKTELGEHGPWRGIRSRKWKYARHEDKPWVLYDLENDPYELTNLAGRAGHRQLIAGFDKAIAAQMAATGDRWDELFDRPYRALE